MVEPDVFLTIRKTAPFATKNTVFLVIILSLYQYSQFKCYDDAVAAVFVIIMLASRRQLHHPHARAWLSRGGTVDLACNI